MVGMAHLLPTWQGQAAAAATAEPTPTPASPLHPTHSLGSAQAAVAAAVAHHKRHPFPCRVELNECLSLWCHAPETLACDALVNANPDTFGEPSSRARAIFQAAGAGLQDEMAPIRACRTGDTYVSLGYNLPAKHIIHTVGPRYNSRYRTAAESALYNCYRNIFEQILDRKLRTVGLTTIHSLQRQYPMEEGAHLALRVLRRFLEQHHTAVDRIVMIVSELELRVYTKLLPIYFPRNTQEEGETLARVPLDIGNENGEPVIEERTIRIADTLTKANQGGTSVLQDESFDAKGFASMEGDFDEARKAKLSQADARLSQQLQRQEAYDSYLRSSRHVDFSDLDAQELLKLEGEDVHGRRVVTICGKNFPPRNASQKRQLQYFLYHMHDVVKEEYVILYLHTLGSSSQRPDPGVVRELLALIDARYANNLAKVFILHANWWTKIAAWFIGTFALSHLKPKFCYVDSLQELHTHIAKDQLVLPAYVLDYDRQENAAHYAQNAEEPASGRSGL